MIFQPPTTILTRFFGPRIWLASLTLAWGIVMIGFGFVQDWTALVGLRLLLGVLEVRKNADQHTQAPHTDQSLRTEWLLSWCRLPSQYLV